MDVDTTVRDQKPEVIRNEFQTENTEYQKFLTEISRLKGPGKRTVQTTDAEIEQLKEKAWLVYEKRFK